MESSGVPLLPRLRRRARGAPAQGRPTRSGSVCTACGFVVLPRSQGRGRHDHPRPTTTGSCWCAARSSRAMGCGCFPGGYVDRGEEITAAALREAQGGVGPRRPHRRPGQHLLVLGGAPIIIVYAATALGGELCGDDECLEAGLFTPDEIPWDELAFRSTTEALRDYFKTESAELETEIAPRPDARDPRRPAGRRWYTSRLPSCDKLRRSARWPPAAGSSSGGRGSILIRLDHDEETCAVAVAVAVGGSPRPRCFDFEHKSTLGPIGDRHRARCSAAGPRPTLIPSPSTCTDFKWNVTRADRQHRERNVQRDLRRRSEA